MSRLLKLLVIALVAGWVLRHFLVEGIYVASGSMEPTLGIGSHYFVNKLVYRVAQPRRGDIVVFADPTDPKIGLIKRVIGIPGDRIEMRDKKVILNGQPMQESYTKYTRPNEVLAGDNMPEVTVPPESLFVLGDNRDQSEDSSYWKDPQTGARILFVPYRLVHGKLIQL